MKFTAIAVALTLAATTVSAYQGPVAGCKQVVTVKKGDSCEALAASHHITVPELIKINTGLHWGPGHYCDNLDVGKKYCVKGPNSKSTSTHNKSVEHKEKCAKKKAKKAAALKKAQEDAAKKSSHKKTTKKHTTKKSTKKTTKAHHTTKKPTTSKPSGDTSGPIAHRTIASCKVYHLVTPQDGCESVMSKFHISPADFFKWNPGVHHSADHDCDNLDTGKRYCVKA
ncbi:hypothetical protein INT43_003373 [Umbelopsis isabellina]|uniref:LysM domain-containing protein n=1 Tax=Mortierella isabellina TaxID=91625 RepID=A0A8H7PQM7_MORIS|nr:hypothetical protein INT43_003373 [Umbelopsis isabellina]